MSLEDAASPDPAAFIRSGRGCLQRPARRFRWARQWRCDFLALDHLKGTRWDRRATVEAAGKRRPEPGTEASEAGRWVKAWRGRYAALQTGYEVHSGLALPHQLKRDVKVRELLELLLGRERQAVLASMRARTPGLSARRWITLSGSRRKASPARMCPDPPPRSRRPQRRDGGSLCGACALAYGTASSSQGC